MTIGREEDRELAAKLAGALGLDRSIEDGLVAILWSHRQQPSDHDEPRTCGAVSPASGNPCVLQAGHEMNFECPHRVADGRWF